MRKKQEHSASLAIQVAQIRPCVSLSVKKKFVIGQRTKRHGPGGCGLLRFPNVHHQCDLGAQRQPRQMSTQATIDAHFAAPAALSVLVAMTHWSGLPRWQQEKRSIFIQVETANASTLVDTVAPARFSTYGSSAGVEL
jgi:hypothetical protein